MIVVIVGAGPVGCTEAILLAKEGHTVQLYEKSTGSTDERGRSINITLSDRGIDVLNQIRPGFRDDLAEMNGMNAYGRIIHDKQGNQHGPTFYSKHRKAIVSYKRNQLNDFLMDEAARNQKIQIFFNHEFISCKPRDATAFFRNKLNGTVVQVKGDIIIGADGAHSSVRYSLQKKSGLRLLEQRHCDLCYIEFSIPRHNRLAPDMLHIWPRGEFMMVALPNKDESFCGNLYMEKSEFQKIMVNRQTLLNFCRENFQDLLEIVSEENFVSEVNPNPNYSPFHLITVKCDPYHLGKVVLIGDAAHSIVPFYGQGLNAGFQDCKVLMRIFDKYGHSAEHVHEIVEEFSKEHVKNGHAIADLATGHAVKLRAGVATTMYNVRHQLDFIMNSVFPDFWPLEYDMVAFSEDSYDRCLQVQKRQSLFLMSNFVFAVFMFACACAWICFFA